MKKNLLISIWFTLATTVLFGIVYPLVVTGLAQVIFPKQANGSLIRQNGKLVGSYLIGQPFTAPGYFYSRPSAAGAAGYDPTASSGSNLGPTSKALTDRVAASVQALQPTNPNTPIPADLVTTSGSGLDPDISPASAEFQIPRVARERGMSEQDLRSLVAKHSKGRQFGFLGEPRVNVLELNLDLDAVHPMHGRTP
ncbi:MAG TPA: potassium-transporting ATPase subunit KdpC [Candidatus Acidoferrales bacterium]|nr:potassium-transporting ATPase subunit KdpC [Candidatus Acidoferrales bacterium]